MNEIDQPGPEDESIDLSGVTTPGDPEPDEVSIDDVAADEAEATDLAVTDDDGRRPLALTVSEANTLAGRQRQTVLVLAGDTACGKTSVYAAIYERLSNGPFAGWRFAGSSTVPGFEARCHYWRESADTNVPGMRHTQAQDLPWLHLQLAAVEPATDRLNLLLGDFDGEFFRQLTRNQLQPGDLPFLRRADYVGLVVDGQRVADAATRPAEDKKLRDLADALLKDPLWRPPALLFIVTKLDVIEELVEPEDRAAVDAVLTDLHAYISDKADATVPRIHLAVRSFTDRFPIGHGLESLLEVMAIAPANHVQARAPRPDERLPVARFRA